MFDRHFKPSLPPGMVPVARELSQESASGIFQSEGFQTTCVHKIDYLLKALEANLNGNPLSFSDVDLRFYGDPTKDLHRRFTDAEMLFQDDGPGGACTGFVAMCPTPRVLAFWRNVAKLMRETDQMDQDAANRLLLTHVAPPWGLLPACYWTVGQTGHEWKPGDPVNPPSDLLVHHANWTRGVSNKLALLAAVLEKTGGNPEAPKIDVPGVVDAREKVNQAIKNINAHRPVRASLAVSDAPPVRTFAPPAVERYPFGATHARRLLDEQNRQCQQAEHEPDPIAIVLSFWHGDQDRAMALARLMADIEPRRREDVFLVFARQRTTPMDPDIWRTMLYCGRKFSFVPFEATVDERKPYPGIAFDPWASAMAWTSDAYYDGTLPCENTLFLEADACPLSADWIDRIKAAHAETLLLGKRVTGPRMRFGGHDHINGTMVVHASLWPDRPSLHRCPDRLAWDVFHGHVLIQEASASQIIRNEYGGTDLTAAMFLSMAKESALLVSMKDRSAFGHAESLLVHRRAR